MDQRLVDAAGHRALVQRQQDRAPLVAERRRIHRDRVGADARRGKPDAEFGHAVAAAPRLVDEREDRAVVRDDVLQVDAAERGEAALEELLGGRVEVDDVVLAVDRDQRQRQRRHDRMLDREFRNRPGALGKIGFRGRHAAILSAVAS